MSGTAQPPPSGTMRRIPFPLESYQHPSRPLSAKRLLNLMAEEEPKDARTDAALISTPGLTTYQTVGSGPIVCICSDWDGVLYYVSGTRAYRQYDSGGTVIEDIGSVGSPSTGAGTDPNLIMVTAAASPAAIVICVPPNAFTAPHAAGAQLNQIGGTFPGANSVCFIDGYFVFTTVLYSNQFFISAINDPLLFNALDFASLEASPNIILRGIRHNHELWHNHSDGYVGSGNEHGGYECHSYR